MCKIHMVSNIKPFINCLKLNNIYNNDIPPYTDKIIKINNYFLKFPPRIFFKTHNVFRGILGYLYSKNTVFSGKNLKNEQNNEGKNKYIY